MYEPEVDTFFDMPQVTFDATCCECGDSKTFAIESNGTLMGH